MTCYSPLQAFRLVLPVGRRDARGFNRGEPFKKISFSVPKGMSGFYKPIELPCGQCIGCRLERSRQWAVRCVHEAQMHEDNCFITLTYAPEFLPSPPSLDHSEFQRFMKRLRKRLKKRGQKVRFFMCGEYGENLDRPHYHACLFGYRPSDGRLFRERDGVRLYVSDELSSLWPLGHSTFGELTFESAAYVSRYVTKKVTGDAAMDHYFSFDRSTGEYFNLVSEYARMSLRPGIGADWLDRFYDDVYPSDEVVVRGKQCKPPRYYDKIRLDRADNFFDPIMQQRKEAAKDPRVVVNNSRDRLRDREFVKKSQIKSLRRSYELNGE